jgi:hypothetical protein
MGLRRSGRIVRNRRCSDQARVGFAGVAAIFAARNMALRLDLGAISGVPMELGMRIS